MHVTRAEDLLDAALVALARHGERRLTMDDIAVAAGVSRQTVYRHFANKADLLEALASHVERRLDDRLRAAVAAAPDARAQLRGVLRVLVGFLDASVGPHMPDAEPAFAIDRIRRSLDANAAAIERVLHDALQTSPAVRAGATSTEAVARLLVRVAGSYYLSPEPDPDELLATLEALVLGPSLPRPSSARRSRAASAAR